MNEKINTILASSSPRRLELLNLINIKPEVQNPRVKEEILAGEDPESFVSRIAAEKGKYIRNAS